MDGTDLVLYFSVSESSNDVGTDCALTVTHRASVTRTVICTCIAKNKVT